MAGLGKADVRIVAATLVQETEEPVQVVSIHLHLWTTERLPLGYVPNAVHSRYTLVSPREEST